MANKISAEEFVKKVSKREDIKLILHTPLDTLVDDYEYERAASDHTSLTDFLNTRIKPKISNIDCEVIHGQTYESTHGRTSMGNLRKSYERN